MAVAAPYSRYVLGTTPLVFTPFSWDVVTCWIALILLDAVVARRLSLWRPFSPTEHAVVLIVATIGSSMTTTEVAGLLVTNIAGVHYYASPENRWLETFQHLLPTWAIPTDARHAVKYLFDGAPADATIPWDDWTVPLFWNASFAAAMYCVQFGFVALLRRHWVDHERLTFPIMQVPIELMRRPAPGGWAPPWLKNRLFWIGFSVPFTFLMLQLLHWFWPAVPQLPTQLGSISFGVEYPPMPMEIFWPVIGVSFFANTEVIFSLWFFNLVGTLANGWVRRLGIVFAEEGQPMQWLNTGALLFMVGWLLWQARGHLHRTVKLAMRGNEHESARELASYRASYALLVLGAAYMVLWLTASGMSFPVALSLVVVSQLIYLGIARLAFEAGVMHVNAPLHACTLIAEAAGSANLSAANLTGLSLAYWKFANIKSLFLTTLGHGAALSGSPPVDAPRRRMGGLIGAVTAVTTVVAIWYTMSLGFRHGGFNFQGGSFQQALTPYEHLMRWLTDPRPMDSDRLSFLGIGAALMAGLTAMRYLFVWWPLHPIGLTICFSYHISHSFLSFLIAWSAKSIALRIGGIALYRRMIPLFLGILVGSFAGGGAWFVVDYFWFPLAGHAVFYF